MANTTSNSSLRQSLWDKELYQDVMQNLYFMSKNMMGEGMNTVVQVKNDLKKNKGQMINFGLGKKLSGNGVTGDSELEGNEEAITFYNDDVTIDQIRNAVRLTGRLDEQKAANDLRAEAKSKGSAWIQEFIENQIFMKLGQVTTTTLQRSDKSTVYSGRATWSNTHLAATLTATTTAEAAGAGTRYINACATGLDAMATTDILTGALITRAKIKASTTYSGNRIQPIKVDGKEYYIMFVHPWQVADLRTAGTGAAAMWVNATQYAGERGSTNPLFSGALGVWDGVILHEHPFVPTATAAQAFSVGGTAANAQAFRSILVGQQAICLANASPDGNGVASTFMREETFDYGNKAGFAVGFIGGVALPTFNSIPYGSVIVDTGATLLS